MRKLKIVLWVSCNTVAAVGILALAVLVVSASALALAYERRLGLDGAEKGVLGWVAMVSYPKKSDMAEVMDGLRQFLPAVAAAGLPGSSRSRHSQPGSSYH